MHRCRPTLALVAALALVGAAHAHAADSAPPASTRLAFGSCFKQGRPAPVWDAIRGFRPEALVLLGDNVYADSTDPAVIRAAYGYLASDPGFQALRASTRVLATWDDHDYGEDDAGADFPARAESKRALLDFLGEPAGSPRRSRDGVYESYAVGPPERRVQVILLDTRWFRGSLTPRTREAEPGDGRGGPYQPTAAPGATILGEAQWAWLEGELGKPARLRVLVSSIQVLAEDHGWEKWMNFPAERERLLALVARTHASGLVIVSGDRHDAELSLLPGAGVVDPLTGARTANPLGYPLLDLTTSSLNSPRPWSWELNRHRVGDAFFGANFGTIEVDWSAAEPLVTLAIRSDRGEVAFFHRVPLGTLAASAPPRTP